MNDLSEQILQAIDILAEQKISELKFDKTITCTIEDITDVDTGEYKVRYQANIFTAYAQDNSKQYKIGKEVYVKIPEGDFSNKKIITGLVSETALTAAAINNLSNYAIAVSPDMAQFYTYSSQPWCVTAGESSTATYGVDYIYGSETKTYNEQEHIMFAEYAKKYDSFRIKADFKTQFHSIHSKGNYGIEICFFTEKSTVLYRLDLGSFNGDFYRFNAYATQSINCQADKGYLKGIKYIKLFQEEFDRDVKVDYVNNTSEVITTPNIFAKNLEIEFIELQDLMSTPFYCYITAPLGIILNDGRQNITLNAHLVSYGEGISADKCIFNWYVQDLDVMIGDENYSSTVGFGWKLYRENTQNLSINIDDLIYKRKFKVVALYSSAIATAEQEVIAQKDPPYDFVLKQTTVGDNIYLEIVNNLSNGQTLIGDWYAAYPNGEYKKIATAQSKIAVKEYLIYESATFYCGVYDYTHTDIAGVLEHSIVSSGSQDDVIISYIGRDSYNYDANGDIPPDQYGVPHTLQVSLAWKEGFGTDYSVEWLRPDGKNINSTDSIEDSMITKVSVDNSGILSYNISSKFNSTWTNNTFTIVVTTRNGSKYEFRKEILFTKDGDQGTNGTSYVAIVRPCDDNDEKLSGFQGLYYTTNWDNTRPLQLMCYVYKDGMLLNNVKSAAGTSKYNLTFKWEPFQVTIPSGYLEKDKIQVYGTGPVELSSADVTKPLGRYVKVTIGLTTETGRSMKLYASYPIDVLVGSLDNKLVNTFSIPSTIKYNSSGERAEFNYQSSIQLIYNGNDKTSGITSLTPELITVEQSLVNPSKYVLNETGIFYSESKADHSSVGILKCQLDDGYILHPIVMYIDTFGNAAINGWDGDKLVTGTNALGKKEYILAPQVGAGEKDSTTNTFTGVIIGKRNIEDSDGSGNVGLYGFSKGVETFSFLQNGTATIGAADAGQILFNVNSSGVAQPGIIQSKSYVPNSSGMQINLGEGKINAYNFKLSSKNMTLDSNNNYGAGSFEFNIGQGGSFTIKSGSNYLFRVASSPINSSGSTSYNGQYMLRSISTTGGQPTSWINLENGSASFQNVYIDGTSVGPQIQQIMQYQGRIGAGDYYFSSGVLDSKYVNSSYITASVINADYLATTIMKSQYIVTNVITADYINSKVLITELLDSPKTKLLNIRGDYGISLMTSGAYGVDISAEKFDASDCATLQLSARYVYMTNSTIDFSGSTIKGLDLTAKYA